MGGVKSRMNVAYMDRGLATTTAASMRTANKEFTIFTDTIMLLVYPQNFGITIIYDFSWDDCITQEKLETMVLGFWGALWSM